MKIIFDNFLHIRHSKIPGPRISENTYSIAGGYEWLKQSPTEKNINVFGDKLSARDSALEWQVLQWKKWQIEVETKAFSYSYDSVWLHTVLLLKYIFVLHIYNFLSAKNIPVEKLDNEYSVKY